MPRPNIKRLVIATLRSKGPMTDAQLAWWARVGLGVNPRTATKQRWQLTQDKQIRFARKVYITESGRLQKLWELAPRHPGDAK